MRRREKPQLRGLPWHCSVQWYSPPKRAYSHRELVADRVVNFTGAGLAWLAAPLLIYASWASEDSGMKVFGFCLQGLGLVTMLTCSALYHHLSWRWDMSQRLLSLDHVGINTMIMGCYVPIMQHCNRLWILAMVCMLGMVGWLLELWKLRGGKPSATLKKLQLARYLAMGWAIIVIMPSVKMMSPDQLPSLYICSGLLISIGVVFFVCEGIEFHQAAWHGLVVVSSFAFYFTNLFLLVGL